MARAPRDPDAPPKHDARETPSSPADERLPPRWGTVRISARDVFAILMLGTLLVFVLVTQEQCGKSAGNLIRAFEPPDASGPDGAGARQLRFDASREMPEEWKLRGQ